MAVTEAPADDLPRARRYGAADLPIALFIGMRPKQWTKNLFVFIALVFTNSLPTSLHDQVRWHKFGITSLAFLLFCLVSGGIYLMNDVADREQDKLHPEKRHRPIASGRLAWQAALVFGLLFSIGGVAAAFLINTPFGIVTLGYFLLQIAYTASLKHMVILDVFAIAAGFVFRAVAGGFAIAVPNSVWLLVCTMQLALFLGFGKRRNEITSLAENARSHRQILAHYNEPLLDQFMAIVLAGLTICYAIYSIMSPTAAQHPGLVFTLPSVFYGVFRYLYLVHIANKGGSPETILLEDRPMQVNLLLWFIEVLIAFRLPGLHL